MAAKKTNTKIQPNTHIIEISNSDDEADPIPTISFKPSTKMENFEYLETTAQPTVPLVSRSFWKAGAYESGPTKPLRHQGELEHARVHPKFLHSNATSHRWAFGAIAELLDNAVDEVGNGATYVKVDRIYNKKDNSPVLVFLDDGAGMDPEGMRKCMSLGYSTKTSNNTIGQYGNGFKTSTMRLGADVIVFSRAARSGRSTQSIGLLSYTFLRRTGQDDVIVPMIDFDTSDYWPEPIYGTSPTDWSTNLQTILEWSPFESKDDLMLQFEDVGSHGTKILIYNLWLNDEGIYELNFDDDEEDIRLRDEVNLGGSGKTNKRVVELQSHISYCMRYSLRAYASILYLRKFSNFKIILRGKPIEQLDIVKDLKHTTVITYKPHDAASGEVVETKVGFVKEAPALTVSGFNVYHKNLLIRPFWKVTSDGSSRGNGVTGVLEANFIEPAHDKQDFERSNLFNRLEMRLKQIVTDYWKGHCHLVGFKPVYGNPYYVKKDSTMKPQVGTSEGISSNNGLPSDQTFVGSARVSVPEDTSVDTGRSMSIDQLRKENMKLLRRYEEYMEEEKNLICTIEGVEKELEETKRKCAHLSSYLESQKKCNQ